MLTYLNYNMSSICKDHTATLVLLVFCGQLNVIVKYHWGLSNFWGSFNGVKCSQSVWHRIVMLRG